MAILIIVFFALLGWTKALYPSSGDVVELTSKNFKNLVLESESIWIVEFFTPWCGHCQQLVPEYQKTAKALKGVVNVGAVNCEESQSLESQYVTEGFPTIKIFGTNKKSPTDFSGERTAANLAEAGIVEAKKKVNAVLKAATKATVVPNKVIELTDSNFEDLVFGDFAWLVLFFAPKCESCNLLVPHWRNAAIGLKGKIKLGSLDGLNNTRIANEFAIQEYPTIKFFAAGCKRSSDATKYKGNRTSQDIIRWGVKHYLDGPSPGVHEVTDEDAVMDTCSRKTLCIVTVLPSLIECNAECRYKYLDILKDVSDRYKKRKWGWLWAEAAAQPKMEEALSFDGSKYPMLTAVDHQKAKYSVLDGTFEKTAINEFLREIALGRGNMISVRITQLPPFNKIKGWDGKDEPSEENTAEDDAKDEL